MFKMTKEEFLDELTIELLGYEEISPELIDDFVERVDHYIQENQGKIKKVSVKQGNVMVNLEDETDIFQLVDRFLVAVVNNETELFWTNWRL